MPCVCSHAFIFRNSILSLFHNDPLPVQTKDLKERESLASGRNYRGVTILELKVQRNTDVRQNPNNKEYLFNSVERLTILPSNAPTYRFTDSPVEISRVFSQKKKNIAPKKKQIKISSVKQRDYFKNYIKVNISSVIK